MTKALSVLQILLGIKFLSVAVTHGLRRNHHFLPDGIPRCRTVDYRPLMCRKK